MQRKPSLLTFKMLFGKAECISGAYLSPQHVEQMYVEIVGVQIKQLIFFLCSLHPFITRDRPRLQDLHLDLNFSSVQGCSYLGFSLNHSLWLLHIKKVPQRYRLEHFPVVYIQH